MQAAVCPYPWSSDMYLLPVIKDDPLLLFDFEPLEEAGEGEGEGEGGGVEGTEGDGEEMSLGDTSSSEASLRVK